MGDEGQHGGGDALRGGQGGDDVAGVVRRHDAVDDVVDLQRARADVCRIADDGRNRDRAAGNGQHHVLETVLNALADFDFAFSGK